MPRREKEPFIPFEGNIPLGSAVRARRRALGLSLSAFSKRLGNYSPDYISRVENGSSQPSSDLVETIADVLILNDVAQITHPNRSDVIAWIQNRHPLIGKGRRITHQ